MPRYSNCLLALLIALGGARRAPAQEVVSILGKIIEVSGAPIAGASVTISSGDRRVEASSRKDGSFQALLIGPLRSARIDVRMVGYRPASVLFLPSQVDATIRGEVTLVRTPFLLPDLNSDSRRGVTSRSSNSRSIGDAVDLNGGVMLSRYGLDFGELQRIYQWLGGLVVPDESGYSILGAGSDQNQTTIDGSPTLLQSVPADLRGGIALRTASSDMSKGGYTGGLLELTTAKGSSYFTSILRLTSTSPELSWSDPASSQKSDRTLLFDGRFSGPISRNATYLTAFSIRRTATPLPTLSTAESGLLQQNGVVPDSLPSLFRALQSAGVDTSAIHAPRRFELTTASLSSSVDFMLSPSTPVSISFLGAASTTQGNGVSVMTLPTVGTASSTRSGRLALQLSSSPLGLLHSFSFSAETVRRRSHPEYRLPAGLVGLPGSFANSTPSFPVIAFGGGTNAETATQQLVTFQNRIYRSLGGVDHQLELGQQTVWRSELRQAESTSGTIRYSDVEGLTSQTPFSYLRVLPGSPLKIHQLTNAVWAQDVWRVSRRQSVRGGLRLDAASGGPQPLLNQDLESVFHVRTDYIPTSSTLSARIGSVLLLHEWKTMRSTVDRMSGYKSDLTWVTREFLPPGAPTPLRVNGMGGLTLSGTFGSYVGNVSTQRLGNLATSTGLPGTTQVLSCVGAAIPNLDWNPGADAPTLCRDGSGPTLLAARTPRVELLSHGFAPPLTWVGSLNLNTFQVGQWLLNLNSVVQFGQRQESRVDLNLKSAPAFTLPSEGGRQVFVPTDAIVATTGALSPSASRIDSRFGAVNQIRSDLTRRNASLTLTAEPAYLFDGRVRINLAYTWANGSAERRGFDLSTDGDPRTISRVPWSGPRHTLQLNVETRLWWFLLYANVQMQSGQRFTPRISQDVNGDGVANDRAFIPADNSGDAGLDNELRALIATSPANVQECLLTQRGTIAGEGSCRTSWHGQISTSFVFSPPRMPDLTYNPRLRFWFSLDNLGPTVLRLLGLNGSLFGSNGSLPSPDNTLLRVTGFDQTTQRFHYTVNPAFGRPMNYTPTRAPFPPFQLRLAASYSFGVPDGKQLQHQLGLSQGAAEISRSDDEITLRVLSYAMTTPTVIFLSLDKYFQFSHEQTDSLRTLGDRYLSDYGRVLAPTIAMIHERGAKLTDVQLLDEIERRRPELAKVAEGEATAVLSILSPQQRAAWERRQRGEHDWWVNK